MAGFSLGGSHRQGGEEEEEGIPPENLFLYSGSGRTEEIAYTRGFELWQQQIHRHQQQQQQQQQLYPSSSTAALLSFSDEPPCHPPQLGGGARMRGSSSSSMSCQDCGNQAKKDCVHLRCRTCCKSRGFPCPTHVKSTWVPAAKRRERQQQLATAAAFQQQQQSHSLRIAEPSKRPREICPRHPTAIATNTSSGGGGMDALSFPAEVSSPAVFRCVRVSPVDEAEDELAYQTAVSIGGHVFKGILYDQGPDSPFQHPTTPRHLHYGESSSSSAAAGAVTTAAALAASLAASTSAGASTAPSSTGLLDPSSLYPAPLSAFMAGTQFFPHHHRP
ncbi:protein EXPRESSION OF TERPENOIDS 1-like [Phoenix dactylifera]|uniref:Protein EXPRESSION OF TERPENOIDS 1-like n=1 Tax=Phoenix dactylifera TaxID=42345 RepID=A0A8B9A0L9_PHODC|nr:protein EXPRESSION OF TERPENOIDS 1-like [Phoenix dactylifera]XP_038979187.1 protein EXPRESSION OF TERPENOIDS 1-like [Phoenix dactylifera]